MLPLAVFPGAAIGGESATPAALVSTPEAAGSSAAAGPLKIELAFLFFGRQDNALVIRKRFEVENHLAFDVSGASDSTEIFLPAGRIGGTTVSIVAEGTERRIGLRQSDDASRFWIEESFPPGRSDVDVEYRLDFIKSGERYQEVFLYANPVFQLFTFPLLLRAESDRLVEIGIDPEMSVRRYHTRGGFEAGESLLIALHEQAVSLPPGHPPIGRGTIVEGQTQVGRYQLPVILAVTLALGMFLLWQIRQTKEPNP